MIIKNITLWYDRKSIWKSAHSTMPAKQACRPPEAGVLRGACNANGISTVCYVVGVHWVLFLKYFRFLLFIQFWLIWIVEIFFMKFDWPLLNLITSFLYEFRTVSCSIRVDVALMIKLPRFLQAWWNTFLSKIIFFSKCVPILYVLCVEINNGITVCQ